MAAADQGHINDFIVQDEMGKDVSLGDVLRKVTLIINLSCQGGAGNKECVEWQKLYLQYQDKGFEILAFPCDQFQLAQGCANFASEIRNDIQKRYDTQITFPILGKVDVNGEDAHPLFMYLQKRLGGFVTDHVKWDHTKFLIVNGVPTKRYAPTISPMTIETDIVHALEAGL
jgi:glutathione peroxidase